jgi:hypothetical protein
MFAELHAVELRFDSGVLNDVRHGNSGKCRTPLAARKFFFRNLMSRRNVILR